MDVTLERYPFSMKKQPEYLIPQFKESLKIEDLKPHFTEHLSSLGSSLFTPACDTQVMYEKYSKTIIADFFPSKQAPRPRRRVPSKHKSIPGAEDALLRGISVICLSILNRLPIQSLRQVVEIPLSSLFLASQVNDTRTPLKRWRDQAIKMYEDASLGINDEFPENRTQFMSIFFLFIFNTVEMALEYLKKTNRSQPRTLIKRFMSENFDEKALISFLSIIILGHFSPDFCPDLISY